MRTFKRLGTAFYDFIFDSSVYLKDRTFILFTISEVLALFTHSVISVFLGDKLYSMLVSMGGVAIGGVLLYYFVKKGRINTAKIFLTLILVFVLRPLAFFAKGGISNGSALMFLLGAFYLVMVLDGKFRIIMCLLDTIILTVCGFFAYHYPGLLPQYTRKNDYILTLVQYLTAFAVLTILIVFWTRILQKEAKLAEEKSNELEELNRSQNRFFSSMSHEIRTPINTVLGLNEIILRQEDATEEIKKDARNIQGAGRLLLALINDILDISKIEAGKMDIVPVDYNVAELLSEIVNMIWIKAEEKGLRFSVDIDPDVPETLFGDEVRIKQILINLLNNAVKYTKEGSVSLHMECGFSGDGHAMLKIIVSDTGMGIKPEALPHLFDTFKRVDEEKNRHIEGTGLGLSIVKQLVELMDGDITVDSVYGQGSSFAVTLRQGITSEKRIGDLSIMGAGGLSGNERFEHSFSAPGAKILIVDDNEMNLQVEEKLLAGTGLEVDLAISGQEALKLTLMNRYDVIFMDHLMPGMDGIECYESIRTQKGGMDVNVPIIVLTANAGGENIELYNNTGFDGYLVKPVSGRQLEDMLLKHLPADKVIINGAGEMTGASLSTASRYARKKPVIIATSTMSDLPENLVKKLNISVIPYTVITDEGTFYDSVDIDSEELVRYMRDEKKIVLSEPPTEEALISFFSSELKKAHHLIYITLTTGSSREYGRAVNAAKTFENVTIINSEALSSGTGLLVLIAARLAGQGVTAEKIAAELEEAKKLIRCSFVIKTTDVMARREQISPVMNSILNTLWLRPMLRMKNDNLGVGRLLFGSERRCYEKYIKHAIPTNVYPDMSVVFVTYAGMEEEDLLWIEKKINERLRFEHIIFQKASAGISSNCGEGTFGLLYVVKANRNYNLGAFFENEDIDDEYNDDIADEDKEEKDVIDENPETDDRDNSGTLTKPEPKWYESIPAIDPDAAIKNSGSEDAFRSVLQIFYDSYGAKSGEIQNYFETGDIENYTIKVHALKSSSRLVGALKLGDAAEFLETAGINSDTDFITRNHPYMMDEYRKIIEGLASLYGHNEDLPGIPSDMLEDAYGGMSEFAQAKDYDLMRMVFESVKEYKLPEEDEKRFEKIQSCLSVMDWDGIIKVLQEVM